jgi:hypothetical protein
MNLNCSNPYGLDFRDDRKDGMRNRSFARDLIRWRVAMLPGYTSEIGDVNDDVVSGCVITRPADGPVGSDEEYLEGKKKSQKRGTYMWVD